MASLPACTAACISAAISPRSASTSVFRRSRTCFDRQAGVVRGEVVARLDQLRLRVVLRGEDDAVLHVAVGRDDDHQHAPLRQAHELDVVEHAGLARRRDHADEARQAGQQLRRVGDHALRLVGRQLRLDRRRVAPGAAAARSAWCRRTGGSRARWGCARRWCAGWRSGRALPGRPSRCGWSPATAPARWRATACASPPAGRRRCSARPGSSAGSWRARPAWFSL